MENPNNIFNQVNPRKIDIPEVDYFAKMASSINASQKATPKVIPLYKKPLFWASSVAATIALIFVFNMEASTKKTFNIQLAMNDISTEEIITYVDKNIDEFELSEIAEAIPEEKVDAMKQNQSTSSESNLSFENISDEEIIEYLLNEDIDLEDLY